MNTQQRKSPGLLVLPHLRVQNANAISSPLTHGFPSMTAFLGLMWALQRRIESQGLETLFDSVGVICHAHDELVTEGGYVRKFRLTRNPVQRDGSTAAIVEEGRIHLEVTLVFGMDGGVVDEDDDRRQAVADSLLQEVSGMRIAGGSVLPADGPAWRHRPRIEVWADTYEDRMTQFRRIRRQWLPGFALVARDDLLHSRTDALQKGDPLATDLDALLDLSRINWRCHRHEPEPEASQTSKPRIEWTHDRTEGWIVPIPVGYAALTPLQAAGTVRNARDGATPFQFVESLYSIGQWIAPHRLQEATDLLWYADSDPESGHYRCRNDYAVPVQPSVD